MNDNCKNYKLTFKSHSKYKINGYLMLRVRKGYIHKVRWVVHHCHLICDLIWQSLLLYYTSKSGKQQKEHRNTRFGVSLKQPKSAETHYYDRCLGAWAWAWELKKKWKHSLAMINMQVNDKLQQSDPKTCVKRGSNPLKVKTEKCPNQDKTFYNNT